MMLKPFAHTVRDPAADQPSWQTWIGPVVVPLLVMVLLTWPFQAPNRNHHTATAAVVNHDKPVTSNGEVFALGRQLAGYLTHDSGSPYTWVLTNAADATAGLASGHYATTVTIPEDFSARATSAATGTPSSASKARLVVQASNATGVTDPILAAQIVRASQQTLNTQVTETTLDNVYAGLTDTHRQISNAADSATKLAAGTGQLLDAAGRLAEGSDQLADSSSALAGNLAEAQHETARLPALTRELADGANAVANGNEQLADAVGPLADRIITATDARPSTAILAAELHRIAHECASLRGSTQLCKDLSGAVDQLADVARIDLAMKTVRSAAIATKTTVNALAPGARRVAVDSRELARRTPSLTTGIARAAAGARRLNVGLQQTSAGARLLATGTPRAGGGAAKINSAAAELATQLERGRTRIPSYTDAERAHLKTVTANPSTATVRRTPVSALAITLIASLALWAVALATYAVIQAVPSSALTIRAATWRVVLNAALPGAALATLTAAAVTAIAAPVLRLGFTRSLSFLAIALLAAYAFVALNQSVIAILGRSGRHASLAVLLLTVSTGVVSTLPGPLYTLTDYLPTHAAVLALRATATGNPGPLRGAVQLAAWLVIGVTATIVITDRRRYLSPRQLRRRIPTPQFPRHAP